MKDSPVQAVGSHCRRCVSEIDFRVWTELSIFESSLTIDVKKANLWHF